MTEPPSVRLTHSGLVATMEPDRFIPGTYQLVVDGIPQSHVNPQNPRALFYEYVQRMGAVIDLVRDAGEPVTALHLGAGALTLPRYIAATRPGSRQQVIELEPDLVDLVRSKAPLPRNANIRLRYGDARETLDRLPDGLLGSADVIIVDIFAGARTPAHVTSLEFYQAVAKFLAPDGILLVNIADAPPLKFARSQLATLAAAMWHNLALADPQVLKGRRVGNIVAVASQSELPADWLTRLMAAGPFPARVVDGQELKSLIGRAKIVTDETAAGNDIPRRSFL